MGVGSDEGEDLVHLCLITRDVTKDLAWSTAILAQKPPQPYTKNASVHQLSVQPWTDPTLATDPFRQDYLIQNKSCNPQFCH